MLTHLQIENLKDAVHAVIADQHRRHGPAFNAWRLGRAAIDGGYIDQATVDDEDAAGIIEQTIDVIVALDAERGEEYGIVPAEPIAGARRWHYAVIERDPNEPAAG